MRARKFNILYFFAFGGIKFKKKRVFLGPYSIFIPDRCFFLPLFWASNFIDPGDPGRCGIYFRNFYPNAQNFWPTRSKFLPKILDFPVRTVRNVGPNAQTFLAKRSETAAHLLLP